MRGRGLAAITALIALVIASSCTGEVVDAETLLLTPEGLERLKSLGYVGR